MSLLLCFFVLLLSFSTMDAERFKEMAGSLKDALGVQREVPVFDLPRGIDLISREFNTNFWADVAKKIRSAVQQLDAAAAEGVEVSENERGTLITLDAGVVFGSASARLDANGIAILQALLPVLREAPADIHIEGHSDGAPFQAEDGVGVDRNWELSYLRALAVLRFVAANGKIDTRRLVPIGRGPSIPRSPNDTEWGRARNRRVDLLLLKPPAKPAGDASPGTVPGHEVVGENAVPEAHFSPTGKETTRFPGLFGEIEPDEAVQR